MLEETANNDTNKEVRLIAKRSIWIYKGSGLELME